MDSSKLFIKGSWPSKLSATSVGRRGCSGGFSLGLLIPRMGVRAAIPVFDAIVQMFVGGGPQRKIVQASQPEPFAQIFVKSVQRLKMRSERGDLTAGRRAKKHLVSAIDQHADFAPDQHAGFTDLHRAVAGVLDDGATAAAGDTSAPSGLLYDFEVELLQIREPLG